MALIPHPQTVNRKMRVPPIYRPPLGLPLRWQDDQTGEVPAAVNAFFDYRIGISQGPPKPPPTADQFALLIDWLIHFICAPCWSDNARRSVAEGDEESANELIRLRLDLVEGRVKTPDELHDWVMRCLRLGIDPF